MVLFLLCLVVNVVGGLRSASEGVDREDLENGWRLRHVRSDDHRHLHQLLDGLDLVSVRIVLQAVELECSLAETLTALARLLGSLEVVLADDGGGGALIIVILVGEQGSLVGLRLRGHLHHLMLLSHLLQLLDVDIVRILGEQAMTSTLSFQ